MLLSLQKQREKAFRKITPLLSDSHLQEFLLTDAADIALYNFGFGTMIRLKILKPKSTLLQAYTDHGYTDLDDMTVDLMKAYHAHMRHEIYRKAAEDPDE